MISFIFLIPYTASVYNGLSRLFGMAFDIPYVACVIIMAALTAVYVVLGGLGNMLGSVIAATVLYMLPETVLRQFSDYRMLIYAVVLIIIMLVTNNPTMKRLIGKITDPVGRLWRKITHKGNGEEEEVQ